MPLPTQVSSNGLIPGHNPPHVRETLATTYYFDASVSGPTDAQGVWTSPANGFNGATASQTYSTTPASASTNRLIGKGTNAPGTGGTITSVRCRVFQQGLYVSGTVTGNGRIEIRDSSDTEQLGFIAEPLATDFGPGWSDYKTLTAPSGGWSWTELQNLIVEFAPISGGSWQYNVSKVEIEVIEEVREYYVVCRDGTSLKAFKSSDPSSSWTAVSGTGGDFTNSESLSSVSDIFSVNTDTWDVNSIQIADISGMNAPDFSVLRCDIAYRSGVTNELVVAACGLTDSDMGSSYQRVDLWHADQAVTTAGGWTGPVTIDASVTAVNESNPKLVTGGSSAVHIQFEKDVAPKINARTLSSSNSLSTLRTLAGGNSTTYNQSAFAYYDDAGTGRVLFCYGNATSSVPAYAVRATEDGSDNIGTLTQADIDASSGTRTGIHSLVFDSGGVAHYLHSGGNPATSEDLYYSSSDDYGATWSAATEIIDAITLNYIYAAVLDSGKIAYVYDDGGTTKYNEYSLSSDVNVDAGPEALQITENPATVTNPTGDVNVDAGPEALQVQENAAEVAVDVNVDSGPEALQVEEFTATVELDQNIDVNTEQLQVQENIATVALDVDIDAGPEALSVEEHVADIQYGVNVLATEEQLQVAENQATLTFDVDVEAGPEALQVEEHQATVFKDTNVSANTEQLQVEELAASVTLPVDISANTEQLQIQEFPAEFTFDVDVPAGPEQLQVTTLQASLGTDTNVDAGPEQLSVTENAATLTYDVDVQGVEEQISLDTQPATLVYDVDVLGNVEQLQVDTLLATIDTTSDTFVNGNVESLSLQTYPASLSEDENINTNVEQLQLQEFSATLTYDQIIISGPEQLQVAGQQATLTYNVDVNSGPETLQVDTLQAVITAPNQDTNVDGQVEQLQVSTSQAVIGIDVETSVGTQSISLEEYPATLDYSQNIESNTEQLEVNANTATIGYQRNLGTVVEQLQLSTIAASIRLDSGRTAAKINNVDIPQIA